MGVALEVKTTPSPPPQAPRLPGGHPSLPAALGPKEGSLMGPLSTFGSLSRPSELLISLQLMPQTSSSAKGFSLGPKEGEPCLPWRAVFC